MNLRQAAQQALEALEKVKADADKQPPVYPWDVWRMWVDGAITDLRAALAEPEQEPDGISWLKRDSGYFTAPTPRQWVGLTGEEIDVGLCRSPYALQTAQAWRDGVEWAQEQLKEKNT